MNFVGVIGELEGGGQHVPEMEAALGGTSGVPIGHTEAGQADRHGGNGEADDHQ